MAYDTLSYVPKVGEEIRLYTGMRTRACKLLREVEVRSVRPIVINQSHRAAESQIEVVLDGWSLGLADVMRLAARDGFDTVPAFAAFFSHAHGDAFNGYLIEWA